MLWNWDAIEEEGERGNGSLSPGLSLLPTSSPRGGPCRVSMNYNLKATVLDDVYMSLLPLMLNQIESEYFKVTEFEGVLYLNCLILNSS